MKFFLYLFNQGKFLALLYHFCTFLSSIKMEIYGLELHKDNFLTLLGIKLSKMASGKCFKFHLKEFDSFSIGCSNMGMNFQWFSAPIMNSKLFNLLPTCLEYNLVYLYFSDQVKKKYWEAQLSHLDEKISKKFLGIFSTSLPISNMMNNFYLPCRGSLFL